jgi:hypothetical protein
MRKTHFEQVPLDVVKRIMATELPSEADAVPCTICGNPVRFDDSKTDERGRPVHESCYVTNLPHAGRRLRHA